MADFRREIGRAAGTKDMNVVKIGDVSAADAMTGDEIGEMVADTLDFRREIRFASEPQPACR